MLHRYWSISLILFLEITRMSKGGATKIIYTYQLESKKIFTIHNLHHPLQQVFWLPPTVLQIPLDKHQKWLDYK